MRNVRRGIVIASLGAGVIILAAAIVVCVPGLRDGVAVGIIRSYLASHGGFTFRVGALRISAARIEADDPWIGDASGIEIAGARRLVLALDPAVWTGRSAREFGLESVLVDRPFLSLIKRADGSYDLPASRGTASTIGARGAPMRFALSLRDGTLDFEDPSAPISIGRRFAVDRIEASGIVDQTSASALHAAGRYAADRTVSTVTVSMREDARTRFALATLAADRLDIAPLFDASVPTAAFEIRAGEARDVRLRAYSIDYDPVAGPSWRYSGSALLEDGSLMIRPLMAPIAGVHGPIMFAGGELATTGLAAAFEGAPIEIHGGVRLLGGVRLGLWIDGGLPLERLKDAFSFSRTLDVDGPVAVRVGIEDSPSFVQVAAAFSSPSLVHFDQLPFDDLRGTLFYQNGLVSVPALDADYDGGPVSAAADVDLNRDVPTAAMAGAARLSAARIPYALNLNPSGTARAVAEIDGPVTALRGQGFGDIEGGDGTTLRTAMYAGPERLAVGPALIDLRGGGSILVSGGIDRSTSPRTIGGAIVARDAAFVAQDGAIGLPGIDDGVALGLPAMSGTVSGCAIVRGTEGAPSASIDATSENTVLDGEDLGLVKLAGTGQNGRLTIAQASIDGPALHARASGSIAALPTQSRYAAALRGDAQGDVGVLAAVFPGLRTRGAASAS
ncbi:MAG TPA: hypothetical protein VEJ20_10090, partial [Candidatus Eremiobacteraceae bacterium]|nr:hypothetical protein [Candidatus Eremiobacteraceae bacterium]